MKTLSIGHTSTARPFTNQDIEIHLFGRNGGTDDWSTRDLNEHTRKQHTVGSVRAFLKLQSLSVMTRIRTIYAPHPAFNARICNSSDLRLEFSSNDEAMVEAELPDNWSWSVHRGVEADGCDLPQKSAVWFSSADCPTLVLTDGNLTLCNHCGFKSLVRTPTMPRRKHYSVVDAAIEKFGCDPANLEAYIALGIGLHFPLARSPIYLAVENEERVAGSNARISFVGRDRIDVNKLVECQCINRGIKTVHLDGNDTYRDRENGGYTGEYRWWSHERAKVKEDGTELFRNGVMIVNR